MTPLTTIPPVPTNFPELWLLEDRVEAKLLRAVEAMDMSGTVGLHEATRALEVLVAFRESKSPRSRDALAAVMDRARREQGDTEAAAAPPAG